ncbi:hypothetical protein OH76DRAFT_434352 [Lentinus brumalis]|uniref:Uncharacterized protein n=1 Tax=Lentinus brumalis TaxID=2498619 RepID=A0A371DDP7_9APHY|nr:hypothetical protein OH76DRAFT_434352 [Polyporus brumalis]
MVHTRTMSTLSTAPTRRSPDACLFPSPRGIRSSARFGAERRYVTLRSPQIEVPSTWYAVRVSFLILASYRVLIWILCCPGCVSSRLSRSYPPPLCNSPCLLSYDSLPSLPPDSISRVLFSYGLEYMIAVCRYI